MYRVILVEDEPAAAENVYDIIRIYCPQFELVASGENGEEGLNLARMHHPDLLLTDIRMPGMNGLELIIRLHEELPDIKTMILSGYQDFEYVRTALRHGAIDYLLKPISPATLQDTLNRAIPVLESSRENKAISLIRELLNRGTHDPPERKKYFPAPLYTAGICRKNGLPKRFSDFKPLALSAFRILGDTVDMYGRDEMECLHIEAAGLPPSKELIQKISWLNRDTPGYSTIVFYEKPFPLQELPVIAGLLYDTLNRELCIGKPKIIFTSAEEPRKRSEFFSSNRDNSLVYYLKEKRFDKVRAIILETIYACEKAELPQFLAEEELRFILEEIRISRDDGKQNQPVQKESIEFLLDDAFCYATNYEDLRESLLYILGKLLPEEEQPINKVDTPEFFSLIEGYLKSHLEKTISLQQLCIRFGISQTYMSRLFRKYKSQSFIDYLTRIRIEKAKEILSDGTTLIKDTAAMTGFTDQFYFSRVFKSLTGQSPSDFISGTGGLRRRPVSPPPPPT
ncbi:MAG: response regulator [Treponema sp.]|jgi:two-component system response regulator YesN|nr:response regulator [Treponema sp.]